MNEHDYPRDFGICQSAIEIERPVTEIRDLLLSVRKRPGIRSKAFAQSTAGQGLLSKIDDLGRCLDECNRIRENAIADHLELLMLKAEQQERPIVCVLAPMFTEQRMADGYFRRVGNVDRLVPAHAYRVYVYHEPWIGQMALCEYDEDHVCVDYGPSHDIARIGAIIAAHAKIAYCHSILRYEQRLFDALGAMPLVLDLHGAVPEEAAYNGQPDETVAAYEAAEAAALQRASTVVVVTDSMARHIAAKHPEATGDAKFVTMPILDENLASMAATRPQIPHDGKPVAVYAGGTQKWQLFDEMCDCIELQGDLCSYRLFIPNADQFDELWGSRTKPRDLAVASRTPAELPAEYGQCQFGFALREDCTVNRVACPTKLAEYLAHNVIPIVSTPHIGDYEELGMRYVSVDEFLAGALPDAMRQQDMMAHNQHVLNMLVSRFEEGKQRIAALFEQAAEA